MPRALRRFEAGRFYHVYNRVGGTSLPFEDEGLARGSSISCGRLRSVMKW